ncbi:MAG: hypothetical protein IJL38_07925 [Bacteroidales bacterium]|nr:hypothetical protein [Bacteroidales bacterium]
MATNASIFHASGKLSNVIFYTVRGHKYLRMRPSSVTNPRSEAQQHHRSHFALASSFAHFVGGIYKVGYQYYNVGVCQRANFVKHIYHDAIRPDLTIDLHKLLISKGSLPQFTPTSVTEADSTLTLRWSIGHGDPADTLNILVLNASRTIAMSHIDEARRYDGSCRLAIPEDWEGDHIIVYCFWHNQRTRAVSVSVIAGELNAPETAEEQVIENGGLVYRVAHNWVRRKYMLQVATAAKVKPASPPE